MGQIGRRQFVIATSALLASPILSSAQQPRRTHVVGAVLGGGLEDRARYRDTLRDRLAEHGFVDGSNLRIEVRFPVNPGINGGMQAARQLLGQRVDALFTCGTDVTLGAISVTKSVPIVFAWVSDPVDSGIVGDLARPGGNVTGVSWRVAELAVKRLQYAIDLIPHTKRIAIPKVGTWLRPVITQALLGAAQKAGVELVEINPFREQVVQAARNAGAQAVLTVENLIVLGFPLMLESWIKQSLELKLPLVVVGVEEVEAGGLISYGENSLDSLRRGADLLARVLKGDPPGNLPVDQASRFELAVNLKTAKALGLTIAPSIILRADRVIE